MRTCRFEWAWARHARGGVGALCLASSYPETLEPGEKGALKVKLVSNPLWSGPVEKPIAVRSNDPDQPVVNLQIVARMRPLLRFAPGNPLAIRFKKGEPIRQVVTITSDASPPVAVAGVAPGGPGAQARVLPAERSNKPGVTQVEVIVRPPQNGGDFTNYVTVRTTHPKIPTIPIIIHGISDHPITVAPPILRLGALGAEPRTDPAWRFILLSLRGPFRVLAVQADTPALQAQLGDATDNNYYEVTVRYLGGWKKEKRAGKFLVTTDNPLAPKLEVPYEASINQGARVPRRSTSSHPFRRASYACLTSSKAEAPHRSRISRSRGSNAARATSRPSKS